MVLELVRLKTRIDAEIDPFVLGVVDIWHEGPSWPGVGRVHHLWPRLWMSSWQGVFGAAVICVSLEAAQGQVLMLQKMPALVQDICWACRNFNRGPKRARWNIYRGEEPSVLVPCVIDDWDSWE
jgi:hypothetical protein